MYRLCPYLSPRNLSPSLPPASRRTTQRMLRSHRVNFKRPSRDSVGGKICGKGAVSRVSRGRGARRGYPSCRRRRTRGVRDGVGEISKLKEREATRVNVAARHVTCERTEQSSVDEVRGVRESREPARVFGGGSLYRAPLSPPPPRCFLSIICQLSLIRDVQNLSFACRAMGRAAASVNIGHISSG